MNECELRLEALRLAMKCEINGKTTIEMQRAKIFADFMIAGVLPKSTTKHTSANIVKSKKKVS